MFKQKFSSKKNKNKNYLRTFKYFKLTRSMTLRCPNENAIAFGGVATGNMKANEDAKTGGSIKYKGCTHKFLACYFLISKNYLAIGF